MNGPARSLRLRLSLFEPDHHDKDRNSDGGEPTDLNEDHDTDSIDNGNIDVEVVVDDTPSYDDNLENNQKDNQEDNQKDNQKDDFEKIEDTEDYFPSVLSCRKRQKYASPSRTP
jgi:hypothetical protein